MSENRAEQAKPQPAVGQVWEVPHAGVKRDVVVDRIEGTTVHFCDSVADELFLSRADCRCIGISTAHGRVMVGERRCYCSTLPVEIVAVADGGIMWRGDNGVTHVSVASVVAAWPLLPAEPAPAAERKPEALKSLPPGWDAIVADAIVDWKVSFGGVEIPVRISFVTPRLHALRNIGIGLAAACSRAVERGPGIAAWAPAPRPTVAADVVHTWEAWTVP